MGYNGTTYKGGKGGNFENVNGGALGISSSLTVKFGGVGGGGAAYGANGQDGGSGRYGTDYGGDGANASPPNATLNGYGNGGNGGHGGGGGGGGAVADYWNHEYSTLVSVATDTGGDPGLGSAGTQGNAGCLIIYY